MIPANELRIGNWLKRMDGYSGPETGKITQVYVGGYTVDYHWPGSGYERIRLTADLLYEQKYKDI